MKKLKFIVLSLFVLLTLSGCVKSTATMTINKDKSMRFQATYLVTKQLVSLNDLDKSVFTKKGLKVIDVENDDYVGFDVSKDYRNIDELSNETGKEVVISDFTGESFDDSIFFRVKKGFFKNTYTANFKYDFNSKESPVKLDDESSTSTNSGDASKKEEDIEEIDYTKLLALANEMEVRFIVNLPGKSISNNASVVDNDGKRLTWNLTPDLGSLSSSSVTGGSSDATLPNGATDSTNGNIKYINYSFSMLNMTTIYLTGGIGALLIIIIIIVIVSKMKKKRNEELGIGVSKFANEPSPEIDPNKTINQMLNASTNVNLGVNSVNSNVQPQVSNPVTSQVVGQNVVQPQTVAPVQQTQVVQPVVNNTVPVGNVQQVQATQPVQNTEQVVQAVSPVIDNVVQQAVPNVVDNNVTPGPVANQTTVPGTNQEVVQNQVVNPAPTQVASTPVVNQVVQNVPNVAGEAPVVNTPAPQVQPNNVVSNEVVNNPVNNENVL